MIYTKYETSKEVCANFPGECEIDKIKAFTTELAEYALTAPDLWVAPDIAALLLMTGDARLHYPDEFPDMAQNYKEHFIGLINGKTKLYVYERAYD